jgi:hypothetical protein
MTKIVPPNSNVGRLSNGNDDIVPTLITGKNMPSENACVD